MCALPGNPVLDRPPRNGLRRPLAGIAAALWLALGAPIAAGDSAGRTPGSPNQRVYIVQLRQPAAIAAMSATARRHSAASERFDAQSAAVRDYSAGLTQSHDELLRAVGSYGDKVYSYRYAFNGFAARLSSAQASKLRSHPSVARVWEDRGRSLKTNSSPGFLGLFDTAGGLRTSLGLKGENIVIGVIDSGIAVGHPSFSDKEKKPKPRICRTEWGKTTLLGGWLCNRFRHDRFRQAYSAPPPEWRGICQTGDGFSAADCNNKLIGARFYRQGFQDNQYDMDPNEFLSPRDADGHGTHLASIAAGNSVKAAIGGTQIATISGMAPRARIAVYKACWLEPGATRGTCAMSDLTSAIEDAVADGVDVLNYAVGDADGGPGDPDALALLAASDAGVLAVVAAGNGGPTPGTVDSPGSAPWVLTVAASSRTGQRFDNVVRVTAPTTSAGDYAFIEAGFTPTLKNRGPVTGSLVLADDQDPAVDSTEGTRSDACQPLQNGTAISGKVVLIRRGLCTFQVKLENADAAGAAAAIVYSDAGAPLIMSGERGSVDIPAVMISQVDGDVLAARIRAGDAVELRLDKGLVVTRNETGNIVYSMSSRGPNPVVPEILKPDVAAPGVNILGAQTPSVANGVRGESFQYLSGTSMAVPHVAGIAALLKEAHPDWSPAAIRSALVTTARQNLTKEDAITAADVFDIGGGHIVPNRATDPGLIFEAGRDDYDAFACGAGIPRISLEACAELVIADHSFAPSDLNLPSIAVTDVVHQRTVRRRVTNVGPAAEYQAAVSAPAGVGVTVTPATLSLARGETAEFSMTFENQGDPERLDEWGEGSLTWVSGGRQVRSPLAVRTAPLAAPQGVSGSGATGGTSFNVEFGYEGAYTAAAAGLAAPATYSGSIDDVLPDLYTIQPDDNLVEPSVRRYRFTVPAGTVYLRVALAGTSDGDPAPDLDLYVTCPSGLCPGNVEVLASNSFESTETIDILNPEAGEYVLDVHRFETDEDTTGPAADFELRAWAVSDQQGAGNFTISAPGSASVGGTGEISLGWEALQPGETYLGLITHSDATRVLGLTLVNVTVP